MWGAGARGNDEDACPSCTGDAGDDVRVASAADVADFVLVVSLLLLVEWNFV